MTTVLNYTVGSQEKSLYVDLLSSDPLRFNYIVFKGEQKVFESTNYNEAKDEYDKLIKEDNV